MLTDPDAIRRYVLGRRPDAAAEEAVALMAAVDDAMRLDDWEQDLRQVLLREAAPETDWCGLDLSLLPIPVLAFAVHSIRLARAWKQRVADLCLHLTLVPDAPPGHQDQR